MRVKATKNGYYGLIRRKAGDVFDLKAVKGIDRDKHQIVITPEMQFSKNWMEKVGASDKSQVTPQIDASSFSKKIIEESQTGSESPTGDNDVI